MSHRQINITHPKTGEVIAVDGRLSKLIAAIWEAGVYTYCSCQSLDKSGFGYIKIFDVRHTKHKAARHKAERLVQELGWLTPVWADFSPSEIYLRFKTRDIPQLTQIMTEGV